MRSATSHQCAGFDIVLITFDAVKSKEVTTALDSKGYAILGKTVSQGGWYSSRTGSLGSQSCTLHGMDWSRNSKGQGGDCFEWEKKMKGWLSSHVFCSISRN
eukprot:15353360-Ditylum_brightwellii.AAC.1